MKIWNYVYISLTMMLIFTFAGFPTPATDIFNYFGLTLVDNQFTAEGFSNSSGFFYFFLENSGWLAILGGTGITIGLFITGRSDIGIKGGFATAVLVMFIPMLIYPLTYAIDNQLSPWVISLMAIIFVPYSVGFLIALVEFVAGGTSD